MIRCELKFKLRDIIGNEDCIEKIHPYDCYTMGIIDRLTQEHLVNINPTKIKIKHNNEKITPFLSFIGIDYKKQFLTFEVHNSKTQKYVAINDFIKNQNILIH